MRGPSHLAIGPLHPFHVAGILAVPDVQVAAALMRIGGSPLQTASAADADVALGAALCVRALRAGSVCVDLAEGGSVWPPEGDDRQPPEGVEAGGQDGVADLPWPEPAEWLASARSHALVSQGEDGPNDLPLRLVGSLLYLQRYWLDEHLIRTETRSRGGLIGVDGSALREGLARLFTHDGPDRQRLAAATAALRRVTILAGGPGTGKTTTVARIVALLRQLHGPGLSVALAAPTGKAAARLAEAVAEAAQSMGPDDRARVAGLSASTLHRLLGWRPDSSGRFRHDRANPLSHDVVIVDETSMVSLPMMARLLEAVRPDARLVLVGDPDQLASIDAGAVLGDLVRAPADGLGSVTALRAAMSDACPLEDAESEIGPAAATGVVTLTRNYRFSGGIGKLADAMRAGDADRVVEVLCGGHPDVEFDDVSSGEAAFSFARRGIRSEVVSQSSAVVAAARAGSALEALEALERHRVLCAHREGRYGVHHWNDLIGAWTEHLVVRSSAEDPWYVGRPLIVTSNDHALGLYNGDTGVVIEASEASGVRAAFGRGGGTVEVPPARLDSAETLHAMTIHRGQGSQFDRVTVILPPADSPLLTRELLYTAVTRAKRSIRVVGTKDAVRAGVQRQVRRASGLREA